MAPAWSAQVRVSSGVCIALLCVALVMQVLGASTSLWTVTFVSDPLGASLLEGLSIPAASITLAIAVSQIVSVDAPGHPPSILLDAMLLRPPAPRRLPTAVLLPEAGSQVFSPRP